MFWLLLAIGGTAMVANWCLLAPASKRHEPVSFLFPGLLLLIVPLLFVYFWRGRAAALGGYVRVLILVLLALIAAVPLAPLGGKGRRRRRSRRSLPLDAR